MNRQGADFEVTGRRGDAIALVEVKNVPHLSLATAEGLRRGIIDDDEAARSAFFLVVSQDNAYLWGPEPSGTVDSHPVIEFPMRPVLSEYVSDNELNQHLRGGELEIAIGQWLSDLARGRAILPQGVQGIERFAERVRGAEINGGPSGEFGSRTR